MNKTAEFLSVSLLLSQKKVILTFTCDKAALCCASARHTFLESFFHKRAHRENSYSPLLHRLENTLGIISHNLKSHRLNRKSWDGINPDSKFKSPSTAGVDSWLSASQPLDALFHPRNHIYGWLLAVCYLITHLYLKLFLLSTNRRFHQVASLFAFEAFKRTCQCQPEARSWSYENGCGWVDL